jgi:hypothetical protein
MGRAYVVSSLLVFTLVLFFVSWSFWQKNSLHGETIPIEISTEPILELAQHGHGEGDSPDDTGHHVVAYSQPYIVPEDMWIRGVDFEIENAPAVVLHHMVLLRRDEPNLLCPNLAYREMVMSGQDSVYNPHVRLPDGYAEFVPKGTPLVLMATLHNPEPPVGPGGDYRNVSLRVTLRTVRAMSGETFTPIKAYNMFIDDTNCLDPIPRANFTVPPHVKDYLVTQKVTLPHNPAEVRISATSTIVYVGSHMHGWQGAKKVIVLKNSEPFMEFTTQKSGIDAYLYETPHYATNIDVFPGDIISIQALYDNPNDVPTRGAMGFFVMHLAPKN